MSYIHLTIEKRSQIEILRKEGYSKSTNKGKPTKLIPQLAAFIASRLQDTLSSEELVGAELVSTIESFIN